MLQLMAGAERLCRIFEWGRELMSYFQMGSRDEKGWEPLGKPIGSWETFLYCGSPCNRTYPQISAFVMFALWGTSTT